MSIYVKGMGSISPQKTWNDDVMLSQAFDYRGLRLPAVEPEYEVWLDPRQLRRMSRILKMGITAAFMALKNANIQNPDAIITGTGYGCLEDTSSFLSKMIVNREEALNPTPFIQSTHNTIGSQIAMLLQCQEYNQTYAHSAFSFESCLIDAMMHLSDDSSKRVLIGAVDEITNDSHAMLARFGIFRRKLASTINIFKQPRKGTIHGEGAAFFLTTGERDKQSMAEVVSVRTFYKINREQLRDGIEIFIRENSLTPADVDLVMSGKNGDRETDKNMAAMVKQVFPKACIGVFKHLCGEFPVASAFALWLSVRMLNERHVPEVVIEKPAKRSIKNILIFNTWFGSHHSLILIKSCRDTI